MTLFDLLLLKFTNTIKDPKFVIDTVKILMVLMSHNMYLHYHIILLYVMKICDVLLSNISGRKWRSNRVFKIDVLCRVFSVPCNT